MKETLQQAAEDLHSIQGMCMSYGNDDRKELELLRRRISAFSSESLERLYDASGICPKQMDFGRKPTGHPRAPFSTIFAAKTWTVFMIPANWLEDNRKERFEVKAGSHDEAKKVAVQRFPDLMVVEILEKP